jgi:hypothetical protein
MENMNLQLLSLFLDKEIYLVPGEKHNYTKFQNRREEPVDASIESVETLDETPSITFEGGFEKGILAIHEETELRPELREMLFNLFGALQCSLKDMALVSAEHLEGLPMESITNLGPSRVVVFGLVRHDLMSFQKSKYEIVQEEGIEYLFADSLGTISESKELKKLLWKEIQILFNIKK